MGSVTESKQLLQLAENARRRAALFRELSDLLEEEARLLIEAVAENSTEETVRAVLRMMLTAEEAPDCPGVYCIGGLDGLVKIGRTGTSVRARLVDLQVANPQPLRFLALLDADPGREKFWHRNFRKQRVSGEWYRLTPELAGIINDVKAQQRAS